MDASGFRMRHCYLTAVVTAAAVRVPHSVPSGSIEDTTAPLPAPVGSISQSAKNQAKSERKKTSEYRRNGITKTTGGTSGE
jgi:hypothetical protein